MDSNEPVLSLPHSMKRTINWYITGIFLLAVFMAADILPHLSMVNQLSDQELPVKTESENPNKSSEENATHGYNEYWIDHNTGHIITPLFITLLRKNFPGNSFFPDQVFLPVLTPPPDNTRVV